MNRVREYLFRRFNPGKPWLTPQAIIFLDLWLSEEDFGLEFGSGRSTLWLAKRSKTLVSVEDNQNWYSKLKSGLSEKKVNNVDYRYCRTNLGERPEESEYVRPLLDFPDGSFDYILVDGSHRDYIALNCLSKLKYGGIVVIDNANWFLPHQTFSPTSIGSHRPPLNETWNKFYIAVKEWRQIWTSNGVTDTAIFIKRFER